MNIELCSHNTEIQIYDAIPMASVISIKRSKKSELQVHPSNQKKHMKLQTKLIEDTY